MSNKQIEYSNRKIRIAILGLGTVGSGVYEMAKENANIEIVKIFERHNRTAISTTNFDDIINNEEIDVIVETMGGLDPTYKFAKQTLENNKHFITANKLLVKKHGKELTEIAQKNKVAFLYNSACGGGIPFLENLKNVKKFDEILDLGGILNGTTNFMLDIMSKEKLTYKEALKLAQDLGYAEADPTSDVCGFDTARKLVLACFVGYNYLINIENILIYGISTIQDIDIQYADRNNSIIKLCCFAKKEKDNITAIVEPILFDKSRIENSITKNMNYAWLEGKNCGLLGFIGQGAGKLPTASNIIRDIESIRINQLYLTSRNVLEKNINNDILKYKYYVRIPQNEFFDEELIEKETSNKDYKFIETKEVASNTIHNMFKNNENCFFARIFNNK